MMEFKIPRRGLRTALHLIALCLASGCAEYNEHFDADTKPGSPKDGDRLEIFPPAAAITADTTSEMSKVELSVFGATEDGVPSESAHINVFIGACDDEDPDEAGAGSPLELVPLEGCQARNVGFLQCILTRDGIASFTAQATGTSTGGRDVCVESAGGTTDDRVSETARIEVVAPIPADLALAFRGLPLDVGHKSDFPVSEQYISCGAEARPSCEAMQRASSFELAAVASASEVPVPLPTSLDCAVGVDSISTDNGAGLALGTCESPAAAITTSIPAYEASSPPLTLCVDARQGTYTLEASARSISEPYPLSLAETAQIEVAAQPARLGWQVQPGSADTGEAYQVTFGVEDCEGGTLAAPSLSFEPLTPDFADLSFSETSTEGDSTLVTVGAPDDARRFFKARLGSTGEECIVVVGTAP